MAKNYTESLSKILLGLRGFGIPFVLPIDDWSNFQQSIKSEISRDKVDKARVLGNGILGLCVIHLWM